MMGDMFCGFGLQVGEFVFRIFVLVFGRVSDCFVWWLFGAIVTCLKIGIAGRRYGILSSMLSDGESVSTGWYILRFLIGWK